MLGGDLQSAGSPTRDHNGLACVGCGVAGHTGCEPASFHLLNLLGGFRPGELNRLRWDDVHPRRRALTITHAKAGADIEVPMSLEMVKALRMARGADREFVFPGRRSDDGLPVWGQSLRHAWRTIAAELETDEVIAHCLLGHALRGVSRGYISRLALQSGSAMRAAQARISRRIVSLLGQA